VAVATARQWRRQMHTREWRRQMHTREPGPGRSWSHRVSYVKFKFVRYKGRPPPRSPAPSPRSLRERGIERRGERRGEEKIPEGESEAVVYIWSTGFRREAAEATTINCERRGAERSGFKRKRLQAICATRWRIRRPERFGVTWTVLLLEELTHSLEEKAGQLVGS
jgi:hypothetical protein